MDFELDVNGDINFIKSEKKDNKLEFDFLIAPSNSLSLDFYCENLNNNYFIEDLTPGLILNFDLSETQYDKEICLLDNKENELYQKLKIRLSSIKGTIKNNEDIGGELDLYRHKLMGNDEQKDYKEIEECIRTAIKDILPNAIITINKANTIYSDYSNSLMIKINSNDYNYYYYL